MKPDWAVRPFRQKQYEDRDFCVGEDRRLSQHCDIDNAYIVHPRCQVCESHHQVFWHLTQAANHLDLIRLKEY